MISATAKTEALARREITWRLAHPTAYALIDAWARPWATSALRYAAHALERAYAHGCDVLESGRTRFKHAEALLACWERPTSIRAYNAANAALVGVGQVVGEQPEELA